MRKPVHGVLFTAMLLSSLLIGAVPAGAASGTSCKTSTGSLTFTPTLPKLGNTSKVPAKLSVSGTVSSCSGSVSDGQLRITTSSKSLNCATIAAYSSSGLTGSETIAWNSGATSTIAVKIADVKDSPTMKRLQGNVTAGLFKGAKQSGLIQYTLPNGGCTKVGFSKATYRAINPLTLK